MGKHLIYAAVAIALAAPAGLSAWQAKPPLATNTEAKALAELDARVKAYAALRDKVDSGAAHQTQTADPEKLNAQKKALAANIQKARAGAQPGDVFAPSVQPIIKRLLKPAIKGPEGAENKRAIKEDAPVVPLKVNMPYPETQPLSTVPPDVLLQLPKLPKNLEYRFVQKALILYDARSGLIVDFIPNAIP